MSDIPVPPPTPADDDPDALEQALRRAGRARRDEADIAADDSGASAVAEDD